VLSILISVLVSSLLVLASNSNCVQIRHLHTNCTVELCYICVNWFVCWRRAVWVHSATSLQLICWKPICRWT